MLEETAAAVAVSLQEQITSLLQEMGIWGVFSCPFLLKLGLLKVFILDSNDTPLRDRFNTFSRFLRQILA